MLSRLRSLPVLGLSLGMALAVASPLASPLAAQRAGTVDVGLLGRYMVLDSKLDHDPAKGYGARVGVFVLKNLALEFEHTMNYTAPEGTDDETRLRPYILRLALHRPIGESWNSIFALGWIRDRFDPLNADIFEDDGYHALFGLQHRMSDGIGLRFDATLDYLPSPIGETAGNDIDLLHWGVQGGFNFRFGKQPPKDADRDGVSDALDQCPATPMGEMVDARGCVPPKDSDGDGVMDPQDRCADTAAGTRVDASGCAVPVDTDRDGVMDNVDACADTPASVRVDARGCPVDSDGDGVVNTADACPETPAGTKVDGRGCALPQDSDGDLVMDNVDECPETAANLRVDSRGCAIVFPEGEKSLVLDGVTFATGRAMLTPDAMTILDRVAESLVDAKDVNVQVLGHTDNTGSRATNLRLSTQRAEAVRDYLVRKGVPASRLSARGMGPDVPRAPNATAEGRALNRRVELVRAN
jgi:outer membrane protein OmpA-like peptidoglycan-associated protein